MVAEERIAGMTDDQATVRRQLLELIEYVKSLQTQGQEPAPRPASSAPAPGEATPANR